MLQPHLFTDIPIPETCLWALSLSGSQLRARRSRRYPGRNRPQGSVHAACMGRKTPPDLGAPLMKGRLIGQQGDLRGAVAVGHAEGA